MKFYDLLVGVLKVLGCDLGTIGMALSYGISFGMNHFLKLEQTGLAVEGGVC